MAEDGTIRTASGQPFKTFQAAKMMIGRLKMRPEDADIERTQGGFLIRVKDGVEVGKLERPARKVKPEASEDPNAGMPKAHKQPEAVQKKKETRYFEVMFGTSSDSPTQTEDVQLNPNGLGYLYIRRGEMVVVPEAYYEAAKDAWCQEVQSTTNGTITRRLNVLPVQKYAESTREAFEAMVSKGMLVSRKPFPAPLNVQQAMTRRMMAGTY